MNLPPQAHPVSEAQFAEMFSLRTPQGELALRRARRWMLEQFDGKRTCGGVFTTQETIALVLLAPTVDRVLNTPGKRYGTGRESHVKVYLETVLQQQLFGLFFLSPNLGDALDALIDQGVLSGKSIAAKLRKEAA